MKISKIIRKVPCRLDIPRGLESADAVSIKTDSRKIAPGDIFFALDGARARGADFARAAIDAGAVAVVLSADAAAAAAHSGGLPSDKIIRAGDVPAALAAMSSAMAGNPSSSMKVVGVTGTNGKTTFTYIFEAMASLSLKTGVIGTVNYRYGGKIFPAPNTTPFAHELAAMLAGMKSVGTKCVVMEVSSHSLAQKRADAVEFDCCVFTNLTQDHLDYHSDMDDYFGAKRRLFDELLENSPKKNKWAVVNVDDEWGKKLAASGSRSASLLTYSLSSPAAGARVLRLNMTPRGAEFACEILGKKIDLKSRLIGAYNVSNALAAAAAACACGLPLSDIKKGLAGLKRIPGRLETLHSKKGFTVAVDYAHTPDALAKVIGALRELRPSRLITVFGCGGDRDRTKRPLMGSIAAAASDMAIITSDNPRTEDPRKIILDIEIGVKKTPGSEYRVIMDRREAVAAALDAARPGDIVLLAGKGHENYQIIGDARIPFSDYDVAAAILKKNL